MRFPALKIPRFELVTLLLAGLIAGVTLYCQHQILNANARVAAAPASRPSLLTTGGR
jgi:hypothetical protein